jgi:hypothetical protein
MNLSNGGYDSPRKSPAKLYVSLSQTDRANCQLTFLRHRHTPSYFSCTKQSTAGSVRQRFRYEEKLTCCVICSPLLPNQNHNITAALSLLNSPSCKSSMRLRNTLHDRPPEYDNLNTFYTENFIQPWLGSDGCTSRWSDRIA